MKSFFNCGGVNNVEAGQGGILRSINIGVTCPALSRLTFEGDER